MFNKTGIMAAGLMSCVAVLGACSPRDLESAPVTVHTPQGDVVCQLYTHDVVYWDRSIDRPATMSVEHADNICREEGRKELGTGY